MPFSDIFIVIKWWIMLFAIGIAFLPLTSLIFSNFFDKGYIFSKIIGIAFISYAVFILGFLKILPFETQKVFLIAGIFILINIFIKKKIPLSNIKIKSLLPIFILEECIFIAILLFWSFIHAHQPEIHGLEKYMDFGFINSILGAGYFPPKDMWLTPFYINYYYFGHLTVAVLTKLSLLPSSITFNLMLATIAAISFTGAFSIGANLVRAFLATAESQKKRKTQKFSASKAFSVSVSAGFLSGLIITFAGNLHTIYLFFKPYENENPVPFWQLIFSPDTFPNSYWYPNATRFIHNTIHEFPIYSSVVSDLHGHYLDVPFVLLTIAILLSIFLRPKLSTLNFQLSTLLAFLLAIMYMANAWDGIIYFLLTAIVILVIQWRNIHSSQLFNTTNNPILQILPINKKIFNNWITDLFIGLFVYLFIIGIGFFLFSLPFNLNFKPFASGIGILCAPKFLTDIGNFGPFIFETDHCQHSPLWQLGILYGFFYFWVISFFIVIFSKLKPKNLSITPGDIFVGILIILSTLLIIIPEFIYVKDIYPAHYRANTMFKLVYQSFMMLSLSCGYIIVRLFLNHKSLIINHYWKLSYWIIGLLLLFLVFLYPYFSINSYFGNLKVYSGLDGTKYLKSLYPNDYEAILWINENIKGQPVILEAQGDSYTDYARVSANTGLPTVLGWTVHEWLWRGTYDIPSPRIDEVTKMYESENLKETKTLLKKYRITLVFLGDLELQKYPNLNEEKFKSLGKIIYKNGETKIYKVD